MKAGKLFKWFRKPVDVVKAPAARGPDHVWCTDLDSSDGVVIERHHTVRLCLVDQANFELAQALQPFTAAAEQTHMIPRFGDRPEHVIFVPPAPGRWYVLVFLGMERMTCNKLEAAILPHVVSEVEG